jgi:hypothetical protein
MTLRVPLPVLNRTDYQVRRFAAGMLVCGAVGLDSVMHSVDSGPN